MDKPTNPPEPITVVLSPQVDEFVRFAAEKGFRTPAEFVAEVVETMFWLVVEGRIPVPKSGLKFTDIRASKEAIDELMSKLGKPTDTP